MPDEREGQFGKYRILDQIGKGGMSTVHLAEVREKDGTVKMVALKRMLPAVATNRELRESFVLEAKLMELLEQPNIPMTYESGKIHGTYYIAMEFVPGPTLKELVVHCGETVGVVPFEITLNVVAQICDALDYAHNQTDKQGKPLGIVHRDISPGNIIISEQGVVKLIDFGLAKAKTSSVETGEGVIKGKFNYVAPEYLGGKLDARADLWAMGVVMYELLTSRRLFDGHDNFETINRVRKLPIPPPSRVNARVSPELEEIVMKALIRDPRRRWQSAAEMRAAVLAVADQTGDRVDNRHVIDWVNWVFTQKPGTEASGVSKLLSITKPMRAVTPPEEDQPIKPSGGIQWLRKILTPRPKR